MEPNRKFKGVRIIFVRYVSGIAFYLKVEERVLKPILG